MTEAKPGTAWHSNASLRLARPGVAKHSTVMTGAELKDLRKRLGLSLQQAARQVEVSTRTWARWEVSERVPDGVVKLFEIENKLRKPSG